MVDHSSLDDIVMMIEEEVRRVSGVGEVDKAVGLYVLAISLVPSGRVLRRAVDRNSVIWPRQQLERAVTI